MNRNLVKKSSIFVISSQVISLITNIIKTLIIPIIIIDMKMYAYWQVYLFYLSYILLISLGFNDGIYLKYTGKKSKEIDECKELFASSKFHLLISTFIMIIFIAFIYFFTNSEKTYIYILICLNIIPMEFIDINLRLYQAKFEMKSFAIYNVIDKVLFIILIVLLLLIVKLNCYYLIFIDLTIKIIISIMLFYKNKKSWLMKSPPLKVVLLEWKSSLIVGSFILISSYLSILITGIGRALIEFLGNIKEYATYSLAMSITNIVSIIINSIGIIIFPVFRNVGKEKSLIYADNINKLLLILTPFILLLYYPFAFFINNFLPKYNDSVYYLIFAISMTLIKSFSSLTYIPLIKSFKKEKRLFINNICGLIVFLVIFVPSYVITRETNTIIIGTLITIYIELLLNSITLSFNIKDIILLGIIIAIFVITSMLKLTLITIVLLFVCGIYIYINYKKYYSLIVNKYLKRKGD